MSRPNDDGPMSSRQGPIERGRARGRAARTAVGLDIRAARIQHGLSLKEIGRPARLSPAQTSRIERGLVGAPDLEGLAILCASVGLELSVAYPAGDPMRDAAHLALLGRFRAGLHASVRWRTEVPLPIPGDLRAWDAVLVAEGRSMGVEAETRPRDVQALERRLALKMRDSEMDSVILLLGATRSNRLLVRTHGDALAEAFPVPGARAVALLGAGLHPGGSSIVLL
jgi:transcriptional regulator with XRE-family HTH domain